MPQIDVEKIVGSIRENAASMREKSEDVVDDVADKIEDALEKAGTEGRKLQREVKKELSAGGSRSTGWAARTPSSWPPAALAVGVLVGWLIARDRRD